jgi:hypothetical protein
MHNQARIPRQAADKLPPVLLLPSPPRPRPRPLAAHLPASTPWVSQCSTRFLKEMAVQAINTMTTSSEVSCTSWVTHLRPDSTSAPCPTAGRGEGQAQGGWAGGRAGWLGRAAGGLGGADSRVESLNGNMCAGRRGSMCTFPRNPCSALLAVHSLQHIHGSTVPAVPPSLTAEGVELALHLGCRHLGQRRHHCGSICHAVEGQQRLRQQQRVGMRKGQWEQGAES